MPNETETVRGNAPSVNVQTPPAGPHATVSVPPGSSIQTSDGTDIRTELSWMGSVFSKQMLAWGTTGFLCLAFAAKLFVVDPMERAADRSERREDAKISRESHEKVFYEMRQDAKDAVDHDRQQRSKTNTLIREQTKVLESMDRNQVKMNGMFEKVLEKMKP